MLEIGTLAPEFSLNATPDQKLPLSQLRGIRVILTFYPADWSSMCVNQMALYNETLNFFHRKNAEVLGISVASTWSHNVFGQERKHFRLLADFESKGAIAKVYDVYDERQGQSKRASPIIVSDVLNSLHIISGLIIKEQLVRNVPNVTEFIFIGTWAITRG